MINQALIEEWQTNSDFDAYYQQCQSKLCTFTWIGRYPLVITITRVISLISGLKLIFIFLAPICPNLFQYVKRRMDRRENRAFSHDNAIDGVLLRRIRQHLISLNFFRKQSSNHDPIVATRIYIIFMLISLSCVSLFLKIHDRSYRKILAVR